MDQPTTIFVLLGLAGLTLLIYKQKNMGEPARLESSYMPYGSTRKFIDMKTYASALWDDTYHEIPLEGS
jgi:hypothetical protein